MSRARDSFNSRPRDSRISSAFLVQIKGFGCVFQSLAQLSWGRSWNATSIGRWPARTVGDGASRMDVASVNSARLELVPDQQRDTWVTQPSLPMTAGRAGTMTHDYKRNGTIDLFATINIATGQVLTDFHHGHTGADVLRFFKQIEASVHRGLGVHVVLDNLSAHSTPEIKKWLAHKDRRRWHLHFTPTSSSSVNLIERWFKQLTDKRLRRGVFTSVADLTTAITTWAAHWNDNPKPFIWKANADDIITKVQRGRAKLNQIKSQTDH